MIGVDGERYVISGGKEVVQEGMNELPDDDDTW